MHVGSGDEAYGLVDNRVQRDVITGIPNINASGLKGALREYFDLKYGKNTPRIIDIFGTDNTPKNEKEENTENEDKKEIEVKKSKKIHQAGKFRFFNANLFSIPVRSNVKSFFRATCPHVISDLIDMMKTFDCSDTHDIKKHLNRLAQLKPESGTAFTFDKTDKDAVLEEHEHKIQYTELDSQTVTMIKSIIGENPVLMNDIDFDDICGDYHLPLIARNCLENGRSTNIWHEQVVPRESRFYFFLLKPRDIAYDLDFSSRELVQIGGNASIGYGFTRIEKIDDLISPVLQAEKRP